MTVVVDAVDEADGEGGRDPFDDDDRIEVDQSALERVSPGAWVGRFSTRVDEVVTRFVWGR